LGIDSTNYPGDSAPRSYFINGCNDYFANVFGVTDFGLLEPDMYTKTMKENVVPLPSSTIAFGEKETSMGDYYMDVLENSGNDFTGIAEQSRHDGAGPGTQSGGSNYTFMDGSARFLKFPTSLDPLNLWCVDDSNRVAYAVSN
jgi:prepilin-type processing-associated H-X9-DG protein